MKHTKLNTLNNYRGYNNINIIHYYMFEFPCLVRQHYIKNQQDANLAVLFISNCKITLHVADAFCVHHQEY